MTLNKTAQFLLPTIIVNSNNKEFPLRVLKKRGLLNVYLDDYGLRNSSFGWYDEGGYYLYVLFKTDNIKEFANYEQIYKKFSNWIDYYDLSDNKIMHVFSIPEQFHNDVNLFKRGLFSKLSNTLKNRYTNTLTEGIVNKRESTRQKMSSIYRINIPKTQEYMSRPNLEEEIYRFETLKIEI